MAQTIFGQSTSVQQEFDFEGHVKKKVWLKNEGDASKRDPKFRVIVCRHWLGGLCLNGEEACTFLHRLDRTKMFACKFGTMCKIKNCPLKHMDALEIQECIFYKQGFCINGPGCVRKHTKRTPDELPSEVSFEQCVIPGGAAKKLKSQQVNENFKVSLCSNWLVEGVCPYSEKGTCNYAHGEDEINDSNQGGDILRDIPAIYDPTRLDLSAIPNVPFQNSRIAYFLFQAPDLRSLLVSRRRGVWAVPVRLAADINSALKVSDHVICFFCVRVLRGVYGCAKIVGTVPPAVPGSVLTPEFPVQWQRLFRVPLRSVSQLKVGQGMFLGKMLSDGRFDERSNPSSGAHMMLVGYRKPAWDWTKEFDKASSPVAETQAEAQSFQELMVPPPDDPDQLFTTAWIEKAALNSVSFDRAVARTRGAQLQAAAEAASGTGGQMEFYLGDTPGYIFVASNAQVVQEMLFRRLLGVPSQQKDIVIHQGAPLFVMDYQNQCVLGIFNADSPVSENIDPRAFCYMEGGPSLLPIQLRVNIAVDGPPIHLQDPEMREIFRETGFRQNIDLKQTKALAQLFAKKAGKLGTTMGGNQGIPGQPAAPVTHATLYRPPFKNVAIVPIDIEGDLFQIKKRVLGHNASTVLQIVEELGTKNSIRIRMRGIGSGYQEGPMAQEVQEPLHFNVSAETEELLNAVAARVKALIDRARVEMVSSSGPPLGQR